MAIKFIAGPNGQPVASPKEQQIIQDMIKTCYNNGSFSYHLNELYNNMFHFGASCNIYDIYDHLYNLQRIANMNNDDCTVHIMGSVHCDPGHVSGLMYNGLVKDYYIRFYVTCKNYNITSPNLVSNQIYHFLVSFPEHIY